ncbi:undecaprenyl phosphate N,N'-diacetylbacillosamine 1-phosphate transferase [Campylobacter hyointestinalis]|uniref:undecaprenyl phosphate N,N'-diacetylbacillosamine 1-phosphate transferase n=1 Tax=Campylobacter hyointestinalis TaxID=198 RepID=UPI000CE500AA|nr:undecaprenyl phosphate N,N'-diacetylbacillosamine 1-phosphate transferase [Campylobacter hyointestinalis]PPB73813.1 lipid carrier--UDP-N-acetylgalactosaminyltransferase [Campylobacter hyointestinalis subsp. hyointestinalis]PPB75414.1 lipid carrier--UDP-N-acetylgalactosaminyltransferase [Campylobacter hyointestinalis subsp. hyointestinalis]PPB77074.1 lipid carrier--UDP-N-acetylgalactosaminyltransferase [Campylobacter hyointestinalis subsp. hyointestinalis]PPB79167.1 lipid carrier--UDP-N-acety
MYKLFFKRFFDFLGALVLIVLTSPVMIIAFFAIKRRLGSPVIFTQSRPGLNEKIFKIYKFRTMSDERDANGELLSDEIRLGEFGARLRSLSIDELPQLFNVLKGDMSFIGPRPLLVEYLPLYNDAQRLRHSVRPGITGLAQVNGRNAISWSKKFEYDSFYASNLSFMLDLKIALLTIKKVIEKEGVSREGMATTQKFNGHN